MKYYVYIVIGILMLLSSIWAGSYFDSILTEDNWQREPIFITCFIVAILGFILFICGACVLFDKYIFENSRKHI